MAITFLAPEVIAYKAFNGLLLTRQRNKELRKLDYYWSSEDHETLQWMIEEKKIRLDSGAGTSEISSSKKSKSDNSVGNAVTCLQACWFVLQAIGRRAQNLPFTMLEITTLAFIGCTTVTYALCCIKPADIGARTPIALKFDYDVPEDDAFRQLKARLRSYDEGKREGTVYGPEGWRQPQEPRRRSVAVTYLVVMGSLFFGFHLMGSWNVVFPSRIEQYLWRICTLTAMISIWVWRLVALKDGRSSGIIASVQSTAVCAHVLSRSYILVGIFAGLRSMPPEVYSTVEWSKFISNVL